MLSPSAEEVKIESASPKSGYINSIWKTPQASKNDHLSVQQESGQERSSMNMASASRIRKERSPLVSLKGDIHSYDSDTSYDSEDIEWRLGDYIDTGSIGAVYRALDWNTAKLITVKFLDVKDLSQEDRLDMLNKLKEEIIKIKTLNDPNVIKYINVTESDDDDGMLAISMEYVPGGSITYLLKFFKSFKEPLVKIYINQVVKVLWRLHTKNLVHGDIKTSNLLVDDLGTIKLSDFGFIKTIYTEKCSPENNDIDNMINADWKDPKKKESSNLQSLIMENLGIKTPIKPLVNSFYYAPPEVHLKKTNEVLPSFDIWSLGWVWYEMLTGETMMYDYTNSDSIKYPEHISFECQDFLRWWLDYDPENRANITQLLGHKFLQIKDKAYRESQEAINFMSLYSLVAMNDSSMSRKPSETSERLSILQKRSKYQARDSALSSYKITNELSKALGLNAIENKKASLRHINIDLENLKRYSRSSFMIQSLTNINSVDLKSSTGSTNKGDENNQFESSKLASVLQKLKNSKY